MGALTFREFLAAYLKELSFTGTDNLTELAREAVCENARLRAPLLLYAVTHEKASPLRNNLAQLDHTAPLSELLTLLESSDVEALLEQGTLPLDYWKVWNSFQVRRDLEKNETALIAATRRKALHLLQEKHCDDSQLCSELGLNPGEVSRWLRQGDDAGISYEAAARIIDYLRNC